MWRCLSLLICQVWKSELTVLLTCHLFGSQVQSLEIQHMLKYFIKPSYKAVCFLNDFIIKPLCFSDRICLSFQTEGSAMLLTGRKGIWNKGRKERRKEGRKEGRWSTARLSGSNRLPVALGPMERVDSPGCLLGAIWSLVLSPSGQRGAPPYKTAPLFLCCGPQLLSSSFVWN